MSQYIATNIYNVATTGMTNIYNGATNTVSALIEESSSFIEESSYRLQGCKHKWVKIDKSETKNINDNTKKKKKPVPSTYTCFVCKTESDHFMQDCPTVKETKDQEDTKQDIEGMSLQTGILVIGNTGTGKSSLIKLLAGVDTTIAHGANRGSNENAVITSKNNGNIHFIDTVGLQDQDMEHLNWRDGHLLKKTLQYLHHVKSGIDLIKIIFCVAGDSGCRQGLFAEIAAFIATLKVEEEKEQDVSQTYNPTDDELNQLEEEKEQDVSQTYNPNDDEFEENENVWDSVLLIKKGPISGIESEKPKEFSGVLAAADTNGAGEEFKTANHFFGFTCIDWDQDVKEGKWFKNLKQPQYEEYGFYTAASAKKIIENKLKKLSSFKLKFRHEKCLKCGAKGDKRYITAPCHTKFDNFHNKPEGSTHSGVKENVHTEKLITVDQVTGRKYHSGRKTALHNPPMAEVKYHSGPVKTGGYVKIVFGWFDLNSNKWASWKANHWDLCKGCNKKIMNESEDGCSYTYKCCGEKMENQRCSKPENRIWSCCGQGWNSNGCKDITKTGQIYACCGKSEGSIGCDKIWSCCGVDDEGCVRYYPCCKKGPKSNGCEKKCVNCRTNYGSGPGCIQAS